MSAQNKLVATMLVAAACAFAPAGAAADPIILNASFSLGNTGFSSAHGYVAYPSVGEPGPDVPGRHVHRRRQPGLRARPMGGLRRTTRPAAG